jgi:hypothetical protein
MIASFIFVTRSYLPVYFVDRNLKIEYARQKKDILAEEGITDKSPIAKYTPGPVGIGIKTFETLPLAVASSSAIIPTGAAIGDSQGTGFGITLENLWLQGTILDVKDLEIRVPDSLKIGNCSPAEFKLTKDLDNENYYNIDPSYAKQQLDVKDYISFNCRLYSSGKGSVLGATPVTTHFIKAVAKYDYAIEAKTDVKVLEAEQPAGVIA